MRVFLSWSGTRSRAVATTLRTWLPDVVQNLDPWMSSEDIEPGARWALDLASALGGTRIGVICLTPENLAAPWVLFESGAIAKALESARVCTYLYQLKPSELKGPLSQFQAVEAKKADTLKLVRTLNAAMEGKERTAAQLERAFERWWPDLEQALARVPAEPTMMPPKRADRDLLEEVVTILRDQNRNLLQGGQRLGRSLTLKDLLDGPEIERFVDGIDGQRLGSDDDANAPDWVPSEEVAREPLSGTWASRWTGRSAGSSWRAGRAELVAFGKHVAIIHEDASGPSRTYAILARWQDNRLVGRYFSLSTPLDSTPWVGLVVNERRIDGVWGQGRWDLRR